MIRFKCLKPLCFDDLVSLWSSLDWLLPYPQGQGGRSVDIFLGQKESAKIDLSIFTMGVATYNAEDIPFLDWMIPEGPDSIIYEIYFKT